MIHIARNIFHRTSTRLNQFNCRSMESGMTKGGRIVSAGGRRGVGHTRDPEVGMLLALAKALNK
jgi:hypothetical protein